jgi:hypothetical protein
LPLQDAEFAVEEGSSVANMLAPRQAAKMQVASVTALIELFLPPVLGLLLKMRQPAVSRIYPQLLMRVGL